MASRILLRIRDLILVCHREVVEAIRPHIWADAIFERLLVTLSLVMALWILNPKTTALYGGLYQPMVSTWLRIPEGIWGLIFLIKALVHVAVLRTDNRWLRGFLCVVSVGLWGFVAGIMATVNWRTPTIIYASVPIVLALTALGRIMDPDPEGIYDAADSETPC